MPELDFCTTDELIAELMRRQTFCGVVVHSAEDLKRDEWPSEQIFRVHYSKNLNATRASRLLETVAEFMDDVTSG